MNKSLEPAVDDGTGIAQGGLSLLNGDGESAVRSQWQIEKLQVLVSQEDERFKVDLMLQQKLEVFFQRICSQESLQRLVGIVFVRILACIRVF